MCASVEEFKPEEEEGEEDEEEKEEEEEEEENHAEERPPKHIFGDAHGSRSRHGPRPPLWGSRAREGGQAAGGKRGPHSGLHCPVPHSNRVPTT
eukprot:9256064-Pyramimonas_sp.AAC.1